MILDWHPKYETGIKVIDKQHRNLMELINRLHDALATDNSEELVAGVLRELVRYTQNHFSCEERAMRRLGYPHIDRQKLEHAALTIQVREKLLKLRSGNDITTRELLAFLQQWWTNHLLKEDVHLGHWVKYLRKNKKSKPAPTS